MENKDLYELTKCDGVEIAVVLTVLIIMVAASLAALMVV